MSVLERSLHFGPRTSVTTPLRSKGLGFGLSSSCTLKYVSSRGRGNVVIPKGFPRSVGRVESRLLGFPCFLYSVICTTCFGSAFHKVTITAKARFGNRNHLSEMPTSHPGGKSPTRIGKHNGVFRLIFWNSLWGEFISIPKKVIGMAATCKGKSRAVSRVIRRGV